MTDDMNIMKEKAEFFFESKTIVHISLTKNKFYNGLIKSIRETSLLFNDNKLGTILVFFEEVNDIEPMKQKEEE